MYVERRCERDSATNKGVTLEHQARDKMSHVCACSFLESLLEKVQ